MTTEKKENKKGKKTHVWLYTKLTRGNSKTDEFLLENPIDRMMLPPSIINNRYCTGLFFFGNLIWALQRCNFLYIPITDELHKEFNLPHIDSEEEKEIEIESIRIN